MPNRDAPDSLPPEYFDDVYRANPDPWGFTTSEYEASKYRATVDALPRARYGQAFEVGCSIGVLTRLLAERCDQLLAVDVSKAALDAARARCTGLAQVRFAQSRMPEDFPSGSFDLILVSEVGYYLSQGDLETFCRRVVGALKPRAHALLVHWLPPVPDYPLTGDEVHETFAREAGSAVERVHSARTDKYRLDLFERKASHAE